MNRRFIIGKLLITSITMLVVLFSKAQPASERPMPKMTQWMNKVEQNRATAKKQVSGQGGKAILPASSRPQHNVPQPAIQAAQSIPANKPTGTGVIQQQPASGQKMQIPSKPKVKVNRGQ